MKVSVVIPSYNACERLRYNLLSLNIQDYDKEDFEVIVVDDASNDRTKAMLTSFKPSFKLKSIFLKENKGSAFARNCAIEEAKGDIIIFHDSDMIAEKSYVRKHAEAHNNSSTIVCGLNWSRIYTFFYKDFNGYLKENLIIHGRLGQKMDYTQYKDLQPIIDEGDILNGSCFNYAFSLTQYQSMEDNILKNFGNELKGYHFPWSLFVTNNCSAYKRDIIRAGGFDNEFAHSGCEDVDLGYRMYRDGCSFIKANYIKSLHQEHPIYFGREQEEKIYHFTNKYNNIDILLFYYGRYIDIRGLEANLILSELYTLEGETNLSWLMDLYRKLLIYLRDKNSKTGKYKYTKQAKELRQYIAINSSEIKKVLYILENEKKLSTAAEILKRLIKTVLGPYSRSL